MRLVDPDVLDDHLYERDWGDPKPQPLGASTRLTQRELWWRQDDRREKLAKAYKDGVPVKQIALDLGCPLGTVVSQAYRLKLVHMFADYELRMQRHNQGRKPPKRKKSCCSR